MKTSITLPSPARRLAVIAGFATLMSPLHALNLDFGSSPGAMLRFVGDSTFVFDDATSGAFTGTDVLINLSSSGRTGSNSAVGLLGHIGGTFTIGTITAGVAPVTGSGTLSIDDGSQLFSGTLQWGQMHQTATSGNLNLAGVVNVTGITYAGSNQDLIELAAPGSAAAVLSFSFASPGYSLSQLATTRVITSYTGDLHSPSSVPDHGASLFGLAATLAALGFGRRLAGPAGR